MKHLSIPGINWQKCGVAMWVLRWNLKSVSTVKLLASLLPVIIPSHPTRSEHVEHSESYTINLRRQPITVLLLKCAKMWMCSQDLFGEVFLASCVCVRALCLSSTLHTSTTFYWIGRKLHDIPLKNSAKKKALRDTSWSQFSFKVKLEILSQFHSWPLPSGTWLPSWFLDCLIALCCGSLYLIYLTISYVKNYFFILWLVHNRCVLDRKKIFISKK